VACNKERGLRWKISAQDGDWDKFCADFEEFLPATLARSAGQKSSGDSKDHLFAE
jgi:hypothetical protein